MARCGGIRFGLAVEVGRVPMRLMRTGVVRQLRRGLARHDMMR